jgi:hypothetical protein
MRGGVAVTLGRQAASVELLFQRFAAAQSGLQRRPVLLLTVNLQVSRTLGATGYRCACGAPRAGCGGLPDRVPREHDRRRGADRDRTRRNDYVGDSTAGHNAIDDFDQQGPPLGSIGPAIPDDTGGSNACPPGSAWCFLLFTAGVATDSAGNIYVSDNGNRRVIKLSPSGQYAATIGP